MIGVWRLGGARQAGYGIATDSPTLWLTLKESFGEFHLSYEYGRAVEQVDSLPNDATPEQKYDMLARHEGRPTWQEQVARLWKQYPDPQEWKDDGYADDWYICAEPRRNA